MDEKVKTAFLCIGKEFTLKNLHEQRKFMDEARDSGEEPRIGDNVIINELFYNLGRVRDFKPDHIVFEVDNEQDAASAFLALSYVCQPSVITLIPRFSVPIMDVIRAQFKDCRVYYMPYGQDGKPFSQIPALLCDTQSSALEKISATLN